MRYWSSATMILWLGLGFAISAASAQERAPAGPTTVPLEELGQPGAKLFAVPVEINGMKMSFTWSAVSTSRISESFAKRCNLQIEHVPQLDQKVDLEGRKFFAGQTNADVVLAGAVHHVTLVVMRDAMCQETERVGLIGYDIARTVQWTLDPVACTMTIAAPGTKPTTQPLATVQIRGDAESFLLPVKIRNEPLSVRLLPAATYIQADPTLQHKWDMSSKTKLKVLYERFGDIGYLELHGKDTVELGTGLSDTDLVVLLVGDARHPPTGPMPAGGIGAELLNRYVFTIDPKLNAMYVWSRIAPDQGGKPGAAASPAK